MLQGRSPFIRVIEIFRRVRPYFALPLLLLLALAPAGAQKTRTATPETKTSRYLESVRRQPSLLMDFLQRMPKGGDLHNHLSGAIYAESFIRWAAEDGLCVDRGTTMLISPPCDATRPAA